MAGILIGLFAQLRQVAFFHPGFGQACGDTDMRYEVFHRIDGLFSRFLLCHDEGVDAEAPGNLGILGC